MQSTAEQRHASGADRINHSGVQPWSQGEIFPAVIARIERYEEVTVYGVTAHVLASTSYELTLGSRSYEYATYDDAYRVARVLNKCPRMRDKWDGPSVRSAAHCSR